MSNQAYPRKKRRAITDLTDERQVKDVEAFEKDREKDIDFILSQPRGRRWLYELIYAVAHVDHISHVPGDTYSTAFNEGARSVGRTVAIEAKAANPKLYLKMMEENIDE